MNYHYTDTYTEPQEAINRLLYLDYQVSRYNLANVEVTISVPRYGELSFIVDCFVGDDYGPKAAKRAGNQGSS